MNYYSMILLGQLNFYLEMLIPMFLLMRRQERRSFFWLRLLALAAAGAGLAGRALHLAGQSVSPAALTPNYLRLSQAERERAEREAAAQTGEK